MPNQIWLPIVPPMQKAIPTIVPPLRHPLSSAPSTLLLCRLWLRVGFRQSLHCSTLPLSSNKIWELSPVKSPSNLSWSQVAFSFSSSNILVYQYIYLPSTTKRNGRCGYTLTNTPKDPLSWFTIIMTIHYSHESPPEKTR